MRIYWNILPYQWSDSIRHAVKLQLVIAIMNVQVDSEVDGHKEPLCFWGIITTHT